MTDELPKRRCFCPTPAWLVVVLLVWTGFLFLSDHFRWFAFNSHKGWTVLIAVASVGIVLLAILLWLLATLLFHLRFQFSLRSLLALVVAVALPLSWLAVEMKKAREQRESVQGITNLQGYVAYDWEPERPVDGVSPVPQPPESHWLRRHLGDDFFDEVIRFDYYSPEGDEIWTEEEKVFDFLSRLTKIRTLDLRNNSVTDANLAKLKGLTDLRLLDINGSQLTDDGLKSLGEMRLLDYLALVAGDPSSRISDVGLGYIKGLRQLKKLVLCCPHFTDSGLSSLETLAQLEELDLWGNGITDAGLDHLKGLTELKLLRLWNTKVKNAGVKKFKQALPNCEVFNWNANP